MRDVTSPPQGWTVLIPMKPPAHAKSRLRQSVGEKLATADTTTLATAFLQDVVAASLSAVGVDRVLVISPDSTVERIAVDMGADFLAEATPFDRTSGETHGGSGLNHALSQAIDEIRADRAIVPILIVTGDVAALRSESLSTVIEIAQRDDAACFVADQGGEGTTILALPQGTSIGLRFGIGSAAAHRAAGAVDISDDVEPDARIDIDTSHDLAVALAYGVGTHTAEAVATLAHVEGGPPA